jgi:hypothetical protein
MARTPMRVHATDQPRTVRRITVGGMDVTKCAVAADDVEGWVRVYRWDGFPDPPPDRPKFHRGLGGYWTETIQGTVVIELKDTNVLNPV